MTALPTPIPLRGRPAHWLLPCLLLAVAGAPAVQAQVAVQSTQPLAFGSFAAGNGSVRISPTGVRTTTGEVVALSADPGQPAQFLVTGDSGMAYAITLPADGTVVLSSGAATMPVNGFVSQPGGSGVLSGSGSQVLGIGATLEVSAGQPPGSYSGTFNVTVNYN